MRHSASLEAAAAADLDRFALWVLDVEQHTLIDLHVAKYAPERVLMAGVRTLKTIIQQVGKLGKSARAGLGGGAPTSTAAAAAAAGGNGKAFSMGAVSLSAAVAGTTAGSGYSAPRVEHTVIQLAGKGVVPVKQRDLMRRMAGYVRLRVASNRQGSEEAGRPEGSSARVCLGVLRLLRRCLELYRPPSSAEPGSREWKKARQRSERLQDAFVDYNVHQVVVDVVACGRDVDVVSAALALGRALVKGGNRTVQDAVFRYLQEQKARTEGFFEQLRACIAAEVGL